MEARLPIASDLCSATEAKHSMILAARHPGISLNPLPRVPHQALIWGKMGGRG